MTLLHRINPEKNEARYYRITVGPCLAGPYAVIWVWGRIGRRRSGFLIRVCTSAVEAEALAARSVQRRLRRGYVEVKEELRDGFYRPY